MKKIVLMFMMAVSTLSCNKELKQHNGVPSDIIVKKAIKYIPLDIFRNKSKAVYFNINGDKKFLNIDYLERTETKIINNYKYNINELCIYLIPESESPKYQIEIKSTANYIKETEYIEYVQIILTTFINNGYMANITIGEDGNPMICQKFDEITLNDKNFLNVFANFKLDVINSFSRIYYTSDQGVVGFTDHNDDLWVLEGYE